MDVKSKFSSFVSNAEKKTKNALDSTVQTVTQNIDTKIDLADVSQFAGTVGNAVKKGTQNLMDTAAEKARLIELKALAPIFSETLAEPDFFMPKFIRIVERDKKHAESEVCQGSIGYTSHPGGLSVVNIFQDSISAFPFSFFPDCDYEFYYVDPSQKDRYIALDEYFGYLKVVRVNELQRVAQDLGATHFRITYMEEKTTFSEKKRTVKINGKASAAASADMSEEHHAVEKKYSTIEVAAEMDFPGHAPQKPTLAYMQHDPSVQNLISMRLHETAPLLHQKLCLKMSMSCGIKESDAIKIDAALNSLKCSGNATVTSEAKHESRRYLEYEIDF